MNHLEIINYLITKNNYKSYLEIGVYDGINFNNVICENKECCDTCECNVNPNCKINYVMTSDEMFEQMSDDKKYDIIFIDAMHDESYVDRDVENSMKHLNENGVICLHDPLPESKFAATKYDHYANNGMTWNGDVYKSIIKLNNFNNIKFYTVNNTDYGLTIIFKYNDKINLKDYTCNYDYDELFKLNHTSSLDNTTKLGHELLRIINSVDEINFN